MPSIAHHDGPVAKRRKLDAEVALSTSDVKVRVRKPRLFAPFRTVGLVSPTQVPFTAVARGKTTFQITTSVGRSLQTYDLKRGLNLAFVTRPQTPGLITATASWNDFVLAAWSAKDASGARGVWVYKRGKLTNDLPLSKDHDEDIVQLVVLGSWLIGCGSTKIEVWNISKQEHYTTLLPSLSNQNHEGAVLTGGICSMPTYTNKVFAGRENGSVEIWNVSTGQLVYTIQPPDADCGPVTAIQPSPALSLLGIAYMNGRVHIHNISIDQVLIQLMAGQATFAPVTSISFRTDGIGAGEDGKSDGVIATASIYSGDVSFWDLNNGGRRMGTLVDAHQVADPDSDSGTGVSKVDFLAGQAVLVTSGADNAIKTWIFDPMPFSPIPRPLHSRTGHSRPINRLGFLPVSAEGTELEGKWLLSSSKDQSFWAWSLRRDGQSTELSQGNIKKKAKKFIGMNGDDGRQNEGSLKAPPITSFACNLNRDGGIGAMPGVKTLWASAKQLKGKPSQTEQNLTGWESIVTGHEGDRFARTWFWGRKRAGRWLLETGDGSNVTQVAISPCGTFAVIGSEHGGIDMYNLQSGLHRQRFPARLTPAEARKLQGTSTDSVQLHGKGTGKHTKAITGLTVDNLNRKIISCSLDGLVKFWDFHTGLLLDQINWSTATSIQQMIFHPGSNLMGLSGDDNRVRIVDIETRKVVRDLAGQRSRITSMCFSNDGRWIVIASSDAVVRTWDLPTGHLIDAMRLRAVCNAIAFSSTSEYLATALEDSIGVDIWTNRTLFSYVPTRHISDSDIAVTDTPTASGEGGESVVDAATNEPQTEDHTPLDERDDDDLDDTALAELNKDITTLSLVPRSRWQTLLNLDLIRQRNRPTEPPKAPEKAPFFLPSLPSNITNTNDNNTQTNNFTSLTAPDSNSNSNKDGATIAQAERSRIRLMDRTTNAEDQFTSLIHTCASNSTDIDTAQDALISHLRALPPSAADIAIRTLDIAPPYTVLVAFVGALTTRLRSKRDYELVQAWMAVFLRVHGEVIREAAEMVASSSEGDNEAEEKLVTVLKTWRSVLKAESDRLGRLAGYCGGVVGFLRGVY